MNNTNKIKKTLSSPAAVNIMYIPALIFFTIFIFYPFCQGIFTSFKEWDGFSDHYQWVGIQKYVSLFQDRDFYTTLKNTLIYGIGSTIFQNVLGLAYALLFDSKVKGEKILRMIVYLPVVISALIMGYVWHFFFKFDGGAINDIVNLFGKESVDWMSVGSRSVWIMTLINSFQYLGISMVLYLAGLQSIPREYYEAADIDGASAVSQFKSITLPLLMPSITVSVVVNIIGGLKLFDVIMAMTSGG